MLPCCKKKHAIRCFEKRTKTNFSLEQQ